MATTAATYDVGLDDDGDLPVVCSHITGLDLVVQRIRRRLLTFKGEYIANKRAGLPYFEWAQQKPAQVAAIGAVLRRAILAVPGVVRIDDWTGAFDADTRALTYGGTIHTAFGDVSATILPLGSPAAGNHSPIFHLLIAQGPIVRS